MKRVGKPSQRDDCLTPSTLEVQAAFSKVFRATAPEARHWGAHHLESYEWATQELRAWPVEHGTGGAKIGSDWAGLLQWPYEKCS